MNLTEAKRILKNNGYKVLIESSEKAPVYLYFDKPENPKDKVWFEAFGTDASGVKLYLNIDYFERLLSKLGVSNKFFKLIDFLDWDGIQEEYVNEENKPNGGTYSVGEAMCDNSSDGCYFTAQVYTEPEYGVAYFLRYITAEALLNLFNSANIQFDDLVDYIDNKNIEDIFTDNEGCKQCIDKFGVTIDDVVDFVNAMLNDKLIQTLANVIQATPDFRERHY